MKTFNVLVLPVLAGLATFMAQSYFAPPQLHAAPFAVPATADWRQQMLASDPGGAIIDRKLAQLSDRLDLTSEQRAKLRPLLTAQHDQILALLVAGPANLTRGEFISQRQAIRDRTHQGLRAMLTPDQQQLYTYLRPRGA